MRLVLTVLLFVTTSCLFGGDDEIEPVVIDPVPPIATVLEPGLADLALWLSGSFTDGAPGVAGRRFHGVRIWTERPELWMYVERAGAPHGLLQEVWRFERRRDASLSIHVHDLPAPASEFAGAWRDEEPLAAIGPKDLVPRPGARLTLLERANTFQGGSTTSARIVVGSDRLLWQEDAVIGVVAFSRVR